MTRIVVSLIMLHLFFCSSCLTHKIDDATTKTSNNTTCVSSKGDTTLGNNVSIEYDIPILIDTTWYLPFWDKIFLGAKMKLLYLQKDTIKIASVGVLLRKDNILLYDKYKDKIWMDWNMEINDCLENVYNDGVNVLIDKEIIFLDENKMIRDTIYTFQTYNENGVIAKNKAGELKVYGLNTKKDWIEFLKDSAVVVTGPRYIIHVSCYHQISKKRGIISRTTCRDTSISLICNYNTDYTNYGQFINKKLPNLRTQKRTFFPKMDFKKDFNIDNNYYFNYIQIDTSSILIGERHYYNFRVGVTLKSKDYYKTIASSSIMGVVLPQLGCIRMENGKLWATGRMTYEMRFSKFKEYEQLIFDFKAKKGTTWQVQKHELFGGEITYIGKRDKITYQYSIEPNESNGFPNLVGFEVNEDWGFTRFDFRNDDGEIVSYDMIKD